MGRNVMRLVLGLVVAALAGSALAADNAEEAAIERAIVRGKHLYDYDEAALLGSDALTTRLTPEARAQLRGVVVEPVGDSLRATYYGLHGDDPFSIYTAVYKDEAVASDHATAPGENTRLSNTALELYRARAAAEGAPRLSCSDRPANVVVLPPETPGGPVAVYRLTPQVEDASYPFGGHSRVEVTDGKVGASREFTRGCLLMDLRPQGGRGEALVVSHVLDPQPTEIHVFISLTLQQPVFVITGERLWLVQGAKITELDKETFKPK
jgi:hypothetical protein